MAIALHNNCQFLQINGVALETLMDGDGPEVLFLQAGSWLADEFPFLLELARTCRVIAPVHPGFGASGEPGGMTRPDDLAYFYLDLIDQLGLERVILAGASFGGWVAAEMATKTVEKIAGVVLIDALGIRPGDPTSRPICDIFGTKDDALARKLYNNPPADAGDLRAIRDDDELRRRLRARDGLAWYCWQPYMHNPRLQDRLHRIKAPTLMLWGANDGIASPDYGRTYADAIARAQFEIIADAGHLPHVEHPAAVANRICAFARDTSKTA